VEHRAGWDATFSAPKSASLIALVERVREAHRESVRVALAELERGDAPRLLVPKGSVVSSQIS
jgi:conjugative relaxase-like TrwC/TraI family protein